MHISSLYGRIFCSAASVLLTLCIILLPSLETSAGDLSPAEVLSFSRTDLTLHFTVVSTGCTSQEHFRLEFTTFYIDDVDAAKVESGDTVRRAPISVTLIRTKMDRCRRMPGPITIEFDLPENYSADSAVVVTNPFVNFPLKARR